MNRTGSLVVTLALATWLAAPAQAQRRSDTNQVISVAYGRVVGIENVKLESNAASGAVVGGLVGLVRARGRSSGSQARSAALGAAVGGAATRAAEGSNEAREFKVRLNSGRDVRIITEPQDIRLGDCVSVEQGRRGNIRRVSSVHCEMKDAAPTPDHQAEATACDQAKQQVLDAADEPAMELAIRRVRVLCED